MPKERKKGEMRFEGSKPMALVDLDEEAPAWTAEQEAAADAVGQAVKSYVTTTENLSSGKYEHLKAAIPEYLASPGNVVIAICSDGVVIRYEKKSDAEPKKVVAVFPQGIVEVAATLSQNLVHVEGEGPPKPPSETFGVTIKLSVHSPSRGTSHDLSETRIWFQVQRVEPPKPHPLGAKPYCLLSVRNHVELELRGEMNADGEGGSIQPFIARSSMRLIGGWECIEVFPGLDLAPWNADFAPLWAEHDLLGAALIAHTKDAQLSTLDPRATVRRQYSKVLAEFKALLDSNPAREQTLQAFLQANPILLCPTHVRMWPKLPLGATITDFVFRDANQEYILVELERSTLPLFRQDGHATAELTHAHGQIVDWKRYLVFCRRNNLH